MTRLNGFIDHSLLHPAALPADITRLCQEALEYRFKAVCVNSSYIPHARDILGDSPVQLAATVGFPLGACSTTSKVAEASTALEQGATEIDMVLQIGWLKAGLHEQVAAEIARIREATLGCTLKVIVETAYLRPAQMRQACQLIEDSGGDFVKTSTGFAPSGATLADVRLLRKAVGERLKIKASGGIKTGREALAFIAAGAHRIGTSSGVTLLNTS